VCVAHVRGDPMTEISRRPGLGGPGNAEQRWRVIAAPHDIGTRRPVPGPRGLAAQAVKPPKSASLRRVTAEDGSLPKSDQGLGSVVTVSKLPVTTRRTSRFGGLARAYFRSPPAPSTRTVPGGDSWHSGEAVLICLRLHAAPDGSMAWPVTSSVCGRRHQQGRCRKQGHGTAGRPCSFVWGR
jgi:hypothetical protein